MLNESSKTGDLLLHGLYSFTAKHKSHDSVDEGNDHTPFNSGVLNSVNKAKQRTSRKTILPFSVPGSKTVANFDIQVKNNIIHLYI